MPKLLPALLGCGSAIVLFLPTLPAQAHRSGCHRWHSCPSDTGSYVCGDLGYTTYCGTEQPVQPSSTPAASPAESAYHRYMRIGYAASQQRDYQTALINFQRALNEKPGDSYATKAIENMQALIHAG